MDEWYATLTRPSFAPPNIVFPVVWTMLYALIAAAGWRIFRSRRRDLIILFAVYMALNWTWSFVFFTWHQIGLGFSQIVILDIAACAIIVRAWKGERATAYLMIPPTLWTLFAAVLNGAYWVLNQ